jgi:hypothetical protein
MSGKAFSGVTGRVPLSQPEGKRVGDENYDNPNLCNIGVPGSQVVAVKKRSLNQRTS